MPNRTSASGTTAGAVVWAAVAAAAAFAYLLWYVRPGAPAAEDAAMLMRYAWHLGHGLGYAYNPGRPPVDGATDWLGTTMLGGLYALGVSLESGPRLLGGAAHVLTVALVVLVARRVCRAPLGAVLFGAALVICGPAEALVQIGFLTCVFAAGVLAGWACLVCAAETGSRRWSPLFALAMAVTTLARPEGLGVIAFSLAAAAFVLDRPAWWRLVAWTVFLAGPILLAFVAWRTWYFGHLLPLPFLRKGGGTLHWDGLSDSIRGATLLVGWCVPVVLFGLLRGGRGARWAAALAVFIGGYLGMWVLLSSEMNLFWRFQYAVMPVVAATWWLPIRDTWEDRGWRASVPRAIAQPLLVTLAIVACAIVGETQRSFRPLATADGRVAIGRLLHDLGGPHAVLATTEAGLLPLYSGWQSIDAWGLNDRRVIADGGLTEQYLADAAPDVIVFHAWFTPLTRKSFHAGTDWDRMVLTMERYAECHGYTLAAVYAPEFSQAHYYYVKPSWAGAPRLVEALRTTPYAWWGSGAPTVELSALHAASAMECRP